MVKKGSNIPTLVNTLSLLIVLVFYVFSTSSSISNAEVTNFTNNDLPSRSSLLEEFSEEEEMLMESEISRRFLLGQTKGKKYITYPTLKKGAAASCNSNSYSGCLGKTSNRFDRGCLKIYRCRH